VVLKDDIIGFRRPKTKKRGELIMTQGYFPFKIEEEKKKKNLTSLTGLLLYLELFGALKLDVLIGQTLNIRKVQGWRDERVILSLIFLNIAGGSSVSDIDQLEKDEGFCRILQALDLHGKMGRRREQIRSYWRNKRKNAVPSPSSIFRYLANFHNAEEEKKREEGKAFIPSPNANLVKLPRINSGLLKFVQRLNPQPFATLDIDATIVATNKQSALYAYKGGKGYQPINVWWFEQEMVLHTEFRDGNVPAGYEIQRVLKESLRYLPKGVKEVYLRSDSAAYQHELLKYCDKGENEQYGRIRFAIGSDITESFKRAVLSDKELEWNPIYKIDTEGETESGQEWAEVCFIPEDISRSKKGCEYRYIGIREELKQRILPGMEDQSPLPFQTLEMGIKRYKLTAVVTNLDWNGEEVIHWYRKRAGKSEEAHSIMKEDLAGGQFPSNDFGENAAWWWIMILALNVNGIMKQYVLDKGWKPKRMKAIRFNIIHIAGRVISKGKELIVKIANDHPSFELLLMARQRIMEIASLSPG